MLEFFNGAILCVGVMFLFFVGIALERTLQNLAAYIHARTLLTRAESEKIERSLAPSSIPPRRPFCSSNPSFPAF